jgi:chemotaxis protein methyltransferase CheR
METTGALKKLEEALAEHYGWSTHPALREKVSTAIASKAERLGIEPHEYCRIAASSQSELLALVEEAASSESFFFREPNQFECLRTRILPELMDSHPPNGKLRFWSAACSTGEEAYSLAIIFNQARLEDSQQQVEVFATDVRNKALLAASQARYRLISLRELDGQIRDRYFERTGEACETGSAEFFTVAPSIRRLVTFRRVNLLDKLFWKGVGGRFDLIIYANQMIYLHGTAVRQMIANLTNSLRVGGYLMVAPPEINLINSSRFIQHADEPTFFRRIL